MAGFHLIPGSDFCITAHFRLPVCSSDSGIKILKTLSSLSIVIHHLVSQCRFGGLILLKELLLCSFHSRTKYRISPQVAEHTWLVGREGHAESKRVKGEITRVWALQV